MYSRNEILMQPARAHIMGGISNELHVLGSQLTEETGGHQLSVFLLEEIVRLTESHRHVSKLYIFFFATLRPHGDELAFAGGSTGHFVTEEELPDNISVCLRNLGPMDRCILPQHLWVVGVGEQINNPIALWLQMGQTFSSPGQKRKWLRIVFESAVLWFKYLQENHTVLLPSSRQPCCRKEYWWKDRTLVRLTSEVFSSPAGLFGGHVLEPSLSLSVHQSHSIFWISIFLPPLFGIHSLLSLYSHDRSSYKPHRRPCSCEPYLKYLEKNHT